MPILPISIIPINSTCATTTTYSKDGKTATSTTTAPSKEHDVVLKAVMRVGDYSNELTGVCDLGYMFGGSYRKAAQDLVGSRKKWVKANYTRLKPKSLRLTTPMHDRGAAAVRA
jgi:hypothetical protein